MTVSARLRSVLAAKAAWRARHGRLDPLGEGDGLRSRALCWSSVLQRVRRWRGAAPAAGFEPARPCVRAFAFGGEGEGAGRVSV